MLIWVISPKSGLNPDRISLPSTSAIIHPSPDFSLDLLPSEDMSNVRFCWITLIIGSVIAGSLQFFSNNYFHIGRNFICLVKSFGSLGMRDWNVNFWNIWIVRFLM